MPFKREVEDKLQQNKEQIINWYTIDYLGFKHIARKLSLQDETIRNFLIKSNIEVRKAVNTLYIYLQLKLLFMNDKTQQLIINIINDIDFYTNPNNLIPISISKEKGTLFKFDNNKEANLFKKLLGQDYKGIVVRKNIVLVETLYEKESTTRQLIEFIRYYLCLENNMEYVEYETNNYSK